MSLLICWLVLPLVLGLLALGCGLLLEAVTGRPLAGALLAPVGLAVAVVVAQFAVLSNATAELASPLVVALATAGFLLAGRARLRAVDGWALGSAVAVFAIFAAPVVLSGHATFAGYIKLDDTATWLAITDRMMDHGRDLGGLAPSTYEATLQSYLGNAYPLGSFLPLGIAHEILGQDSAWLFQPVLSFYAAMLALTLYALAEPLVPSRRLRALVAFAASQPALLFGYALWGGIKELAAAWVLATVAATLVPLARAPFELRALLPAAVVCAATLSILSIGGGVWLVPPLAIVLVLLLRSVRVTAAAVYAAIFVAAFVLLSIPALTTANTFLTIGKVVLTSESELGNLVGPLNGLQVLGIWPVGDFRFDPSNMSATYILLAVLVLAAVGATVVAWKRASWGPLLYLASAGIGCLIVTRAGSPWVNGKAMTTASPAFVFVAMLGAALVVQRGRRVEGGLIAAAIVAGVLWGNFLAYHDVNLAPRDRMAELATIGHQIAGEGPALMTDYEPYGARHFLRDADPEGVSEFRRRTIALRDGRVLEKIEVADVDQIVLDPVLIYRTLVLRRSPVASRPPSVYSLVSKDRYYEVWQRPPDAGGSILNHLSLGTPTNPVARPDCAAVLRLAGEAGSNGRLITVERPPPVSVPLDQTAYPPGWHANGGGQLTPASAGRVQTLFSLPRAGRYKLWVGGSFRRQIQLRIDDRTVASARNDLSHAGEYVPLGAADLSTGVHNLELIYGKADLRPGSDGEPFGLGPVVLGTTTADSPLVVVAPRDARSLCGKRLDWIEAVRG
jgi:hypothetical protein